MRGRHALLGAAVVIMTAAVAYALIPFDMRGATFSDAPAGVEGVPDLVFVSESCGGAALEAVRNDKPIEQDESNRTILRNVCSAASHDRLAVVGAGLVVGVSVLVIARFGYRRRSAAAVRAGTR